jgi:hypothetical protein
MVAKFRVGGLSFDLAKKKDKGQSISDLRNSERRMSEFNETADTPLSKAEFAKRQENLDIAAAKGGETVTKDIAADKQLSIAGLDASKSKGMSTGGKLAIAQAGLSATGVGGDPGSSTGGAATGALSGAMLGSQISPGMGTAVGAVVGGTIGLLKARSARKKRAADAQAQAHQNIAAIHQNEAGAVGRGLENIRAGFQASLVRNTPQVRF